MRKSARRDELLERRHELDAELAGAVGAHVRVEGDELHAERVRALRDEHADPAEPDDAERLAVELDALPPRPVPLAVVEVAVGLRDVAGLREQQRDRVLGGASSTFDCGAFTTITPRRVAASTSTLSSADAGPADDDEVVAGLEHLGGDLGRAADHERRRARAPRRAAPPGESPSRTSTSSPAARIASSPLSASCSVTSTRFIDRG